MVPGKFGLNLLSPEEPVFERGLEQVIRMKKRETTKRFNRGYDPTKMKKSWERR